MIDKFVGSVTEALADVNDGASILVGGFGGVGQPDRLIAALADTRVTDLTIISNNVIASPSRLLDLILGGRVRRIVCSFLRGETGAPEIAALYRQGRLEVEIVAQGTLAERLRAAGAGIPAFYTPTTAGTVLGAEKEQREFGGRMHVLEYALSGDVALVSAWRGDRWGNLVYRGSGSNFNSLMAPAAKLTVADILEAVPLGDIPPEQVDTPGIYVDRVFATPVHKVASKP